VTDSRQAVRALLERQRSGVLATLSARHAGWPFASVAPYALTEHGEPLLLLSQLAEHTRNLRTDNRASLFVQDDAAEDPQASMRVTLLGRVEAIDDAALLERYVARHSQAVEYLAMADFGLHVLRVETARFVGGFGDMGWLDRPLFDTPA
jgi:putative heme iron utilization protein